MFQHHSVSMPQLSNLLDNHQIGGGFVYTKNEAFDDLLEILRNSGELPTSSGESTGNSAAKFPLNNGGFGSADAGNFHSANGIENWCFEQFVDQTQGKNKLHFSISSISSYSHQKSILLEIYQILILGQFFIHILVRTKARSLLPCIQQNPSPMLNVMNVSSVE